MKFLNFTFIKISILFLIGILIGFHIAIPVKLLFLTSGILVFCLIFAWHREQKILFPDSFFGIVFLLNIISLGGLTATLHQPENSASHYINFLAEKPEFLEIEITEKLKPTSFSERYIAEARKLKIGSQSNSTSGKILFSTPKESAQIYEVGELLLVPNKLENINSPLNPNQFNYKNYMKNQAVLKQLSLTPIEVHSISKKPTFTARAETLRQDIIQKLTIYFSPEELSIIQALLLGQRRDISPKIYKQYAAAGAVHILAVSGLHVGIILLILNFILKPLGQIKYGRVLKTLLLLLLMWSFAVLAGLSPSVVRAVSMFSFVAIGMQMQRKTSVMNSLFVSLFILLLINPYFIFQVGFQLSYLAVFSIVSLHPKLYNLFQPKLKPLRYLWGLFCVSLAAQIGVVPLSLYYFHQFPGLFFLSNLVILPFLGIILGLGILVIFLAEFDHLPDFLADFYAEIISILNQFIGWVALQEDFVFSEIPFSGLLCVLAYVVVFAIILTCNKWNFRNVAFLGTSIIFFQIGLLFEKINRTEAEMVVFHKTRESLIGIRDNDRLQLYHSGESLTSVENILNDYRTKQYIDQIKIDSLGNILKFSDNSVLIIDSLGVYEISKVKPEIILLSASPKINLKRLLKIHKPKQIIADGSNYRYLVEKWAKTCEQNKTPFHHTGTKGAFKISLRSN